jgi:hypothetical protein
MLTTPDHADALTSVPTFAPVGPKPQGFYGDCDAATGAEGTTFRAEEFNELALTLRRLMTAAAASAVKGDATMLQRALDRRFAGHVSPVVATSTLTPDQAGLVLVDATTAAATLTLPAAASFPSGGPTFAFVRTDVTTNRINIAAQAGERIVGGVVVLEMDPIVLRSDGVLTWYRVTSGGGRIARSVTLNVAPTGVADPRDPMGGDAFDTLPRVLAWLNRYAIDNPAVVTIAIAAGTYTHTEPIYIDHPYGTRIEIVGAGSAQTILRFVGSTGLVVWGRLRFLKRLTVQGDQTGTAWHGVVIDGGGLAIDTDVIIEKFTGTGLWIRDGGASVAQTLLVRLNGQQGILVLAGGVFRAEIAGAVVTCEDNPSALGQFRMEDGFAAITNLTVRRGARGLSINGRAVLDANQIHIFDVTDTANAMEAYQGGLIRATGTTPAWEARASAGSPFYTVKASDFARVLAYAAFAVGNKPLLSPAFNTYGNNQAYILGS